MRTLFVVLCALAVSGCEDRWEEAFDASDAWFMNAWGSSEKNLYAVGGTPTEGRVMRSDGKRWERVELGFDVPLLNWVHGFGPDEVFVVGNGGTVLHRDASGWRRTDPVVNETLWGVWGASPNDVWAVGGSGRADSRPVILHYDGSQWSEVPVPPLGRTNVYALFKVWGTSADNVIVVGQRGVVLRWDGQSWTEEDTGVIQDLISVWGTGPDQIVAVGGRGNGVVAKWDGSTWTSKSLAPLPGLNGVWMDGADNAWVAGAMGTIALLDLETLEATPDEVETTLELHAVFGVDGRLITVGGNLLSGVTENRFRGVALERGY